jgi:uncharacterized OB-fold protein
MNDARVYAKPLPTQTPLNRPFWESTKQRKLSLQHCRSCGHPWYPIGPRCPRCLSDDYDWRAVSGRGSVLSFVVFHQVYNQAFKQDVPYNVALVELSEDVRMFSNVVGLPNEDIEVGMDVEVTFEDATSEITIPRFKPVGKA